MTDRQQEYVENAGVVGRIMTKEDWGKSKGVSTTAITVELTEYQIEYLQEVAKIKGISFDEAFNDLIAAQIKRND